MTNPETIIKKKNGRIKTKHNLIYSSKQCLQLIIKRAS